MTAGDTFLTRRSSWCWVFSGKVIYSFVNFKWLEIRFVLKWNPTPRPISRLSMESLVPFVKLSYFCHTMILCLYFLSLILFINQNLSVFQTNKKIPMINANFLFFLYLNTLMTPCFETFLISERMFTKYCVPICSFCRSTSAKSQAVSFINCCQFSLHWLIYTACLFKFLEF